MFEKFKNIKFSLKKKKKDEGDSAVEDVFSSPEDDSFFSEPSFTENDGSTDDLFGEAGMGEEPATDIAADLPVDKSFDENSSSSVNGKSNAKRTFLLFILFLFLFAYAAYAYILPVYYPKLLEQITAQVTELISGEAPVEKVKAPARVAIQKPPKKAMPKPPEATEELKSEVKKIPAINEAKVATLEEGLEPIEEDLQKPRGEIKIKTEVAQAITTPAARGRMEKEPALVVKPEAVVKEKLSKKKIKVVRANLPVSEKGYYIQAGAFIFKDNLNIPREKMESLGFKPMVKTGTKLVGMHRLLVGEWGDFLIAEDIAAKLKRLGYKAELTSKEERFCVLIGSYYYKQEAVKKGKALKAKGFNSRIEKKRIRMKINYLLLGPYATSEKAAEITEVLNTKGLKTVIIQTK